MEYAVSEGLERPHCNEEPSKRVQQKLGNGCETLADTIRLRRQGQREQINASNQAKDREGQASDAVHECEREERAAESGLGRMVDDVAYRVDANAWNEVEADVGRVTDEKENRAARLKCLGNGQVPLQAAVAFSILWKMKEAA